MNDHYDLLNPPTDLVVCFDGITEYLDRNLPTASAWNRYLIQPGEYALEFVTIEYRTYRPGVTPPGYVRPINAYYAKATLDAVLVESYYENRLLTATSSSHRTVHEPRTVHRSTYAYSVPAPGGSLFGGTVRRALRPAFTG